MSPQGAQISLATLSVPPSLKDSNCIRTPFLATKSLVFGSQNFAPVDQRDAFQVTHEFGFSSWRLVVKPYHSLHTESRLKYHICCIF